jgi:hypothetical protein
MGNAGLQVEKIGGAVVRFEQSQVLGAEVRVRFSRGKGLDSVVAGISTVAPNSLLALPQHT